MKVYPRLTKDGWPKLTKHQKEIMLRFYESKYGDLHMGWKDYNTFLRLQHEWLIDKPLMRWYSITQRGRDYVAPPKAP